MPKRRAQLVYRSAFRVDSALYLTLPESRPKDIPRYKGVGSVFLHNWKDLIAITEQTSYLGCRATL